MRTSTSSPFGDIDIHTKPIEWWGANHLSIWNGTRTHKFLSLTTIRDPFQFQKCILCNLMETQVTQNFSSLINIWESHNMSGSRFMCMTALQLLFLTNWKMIGIQALPCTTYVFQVHVSEFRNINNQVECSEGEKNEFICQFYIKRYSNVYSYSVC